MAGRINIRELILGILLEINQEEQYSHIEIRNTLSKYQYLEKQDRAFITRVCEGTQENQIRIDYIINQFSKIQVEKMNDVIITLRTTKEIKRQLDELALKENRKPNYIL